jgi:hypothetical protein
MGGLKCQEHLGFSHIYEWFVAKAEVYLLIFYSPSKDGGNGNLLS